MVKNLLKLLPAALFTLVPAVAFAQEAISTRVPKENIEAFQTRCRAEGVPAATCWCTVKAFNATRDGAFFLDVAGLRFRNLDGDRTELLKAIDRHGLKASEAAAILDKATEHSKQAHDACA